MDGHSGEGGAVRPTHTKDCDGWDRVVHDLPL